MNQQVTITEALDLIKEYQSKLGYDFTYKDMDAQMEHTRQLALALNVEVAEFLDWLPFKPWRDVKDQPYNKREAALELIDIFFFTANLWATLGMPTKDFSIMFQEKLEENMDRIQRGYNRDSIGVEAPVITDDTQNADRQNENEEK